MRSKRRSFAEIMDVYAFRIVVEDVDTCYRVLGMVHNLYKPVAADSKITSRFLKPTVTNPSHHIVWMHGLPIEIQIRTEEMEEFANHGIAGHWLYKTSDESMTSGQHRARRGCADYSSCSRAPATRLSSLRTSRLISFPTKSMSSVRQETSTSYPRARPRRFRLRGAHRYRQHVCGLPHRSPPAPLSASLKADKRLRSFVRQAPCRIPLG